MRVQKWKLEHCLVDHTSRPRKPHSGVSEALKGLTCSGSLTEAIETLGRLLIQQFGKLWPKIEPGKRSVEIVLFCSNINFLSKF